MEKVTAHYMDELYHLYEESGQAYDTDNGFISYQEVCDFCNDNELDLVDVFGLDDESDNPPYLVCWTIERQDQGDYSDVESVDYYKVFKDEVFNMNSAIIFYRELLEKEFDQSNYITTLYSANVCKIVASTDHL